MDSTLWITGAGCGVFVVWSAAALLRHWRFLQAGPKGEQSLTSTPWPQQVRRCQRRMLASAIVILVSLAFFLGVNFVDHHRSPASFGALWITVLLMVLWLVLLALADIWQSLRERRAAMERLREELLAQLPGGDR